MRLRTVIIVLCILLGTVGVNAMHSLQLENAARTQARYQLQKAKECTLANPKGDQQHSLEFCLNNVRATATGDSFAYNIKTKQFVYDQSVDCFVEGGKLFTQDSVCALHKDPAACLAIEQLISKGYDSTEKTRAVWLFDDAPEYLEWVIFPSETLGLSLIPRGGDIQPEQLAIALGIEQDELEGSGFSFSLFIKILAALSLILVLLNEAHYVQEKKR